MKLCISATGEDLDSNVDPRFGRSNYFVIVNSNDMSFEVIKNENSQAMGGAGIRTAELIAKKGANIVITGNIGPNAFETLKAAGVKVITGVDGKIKDVVNKYNQGLLEEVNNPNVGSHFGMGSKNRGY